MRDAFNILPIVQENMNDVAFSSAVGSGSFRTITSITANGYYGYQPQLPKKEDGMDVGHCLEAETQQKPNRKRVWEFPNEFREFKKRRQNDQNYRQAATSNRDFIRKPTHNIPDLPRCIMEKIDDTCKRKANDISEAQLLYENLLNETHGCSIYHWLEQ